MRKQEAALDRASGRRARRESGADPRFVLYVEGPRDRGILRAWAYRLMPVEARVLFQDCVILGGRRPERALAHFGASGARRGLCVLDCDGDESPAPPDQNGLEFFTWTRRHIESYVLVPAAIQRVLRLPPDDRRVQWVLSRHLPDAGDTASWQQLDAKQLLGRHGELAQVLGRSLPLARIARATREEELHPDVLVLFQRLRQGLGRDSRRPSRS